jgi:hypothetical protein
MGLDKSSPYKERGPIFSSFPGEGIALMTDCPECSRRAIKGMGSGILCTGLINGLFTWHHLTLFA